MLAPEENNGILREAGFNDERLFYIGFAFRGMFACSVCDALQLCT